MKDGEFTIRDGEFLKILVTFGEDGLIDKYFDLFSTLILVTIIFNSIFTTHTIIITCAILFDLCSLQ